MKSVIFSAGSLPDALIILFLLFLLGIVMSSSKSKGKRKRKELTDVELAQAPPLLDPLLEVPPKKKARSEKGSIGPDHSGDEHENEGEGTLFAQEPKKAVNTGTPRVKTRAMALDEKNGALEALDYQSCALLSEMFPRRRPCALVELNSLGESQRGTFPSPACSSVIRVL